MMNFYTREVRVFYKENLIFFDRDSAILKDEAEAVNEVKELTWENIGEVITDYYLWRLRLYSTRKGLKLCSIDCTIAKQWKEPNLNMKMSVIYAKDKRATINDLRYCKVENVVKYFQERNLNFPLDKLI